MEGYVIRRMERTELDFALKQAAAEGWNPGLRDAEAFWAADPAGHFLGQLEGQTVASISAVRYRADEQGPDLGFIGLYIVAREFRGRGYGLRLWSEALASMDAPALGLDAVLAQVTAYEKEGFVLARRSCRYEGQAGGEMPQGLTPLSEAPFEEVLAYDRRCFPAWRETFLRVWLTTPGHVPLGFMRGGSLAGFGVVRPCGVGSKIGPLFADDDAAAHSLFHGLCAAAPQGPVFLDVPLTNPGAVRLAESHSMRVMFETGRMYRGSAPEYDLGREFGVTSFELG
ncbi:MAG: GNAT family N-acetyltransferase [Humidesulfovibrio sp.]|uniref:GNAT family N-acetyltransferase n=1 Tax=Humidesulfovibrio sp. TaxID=2910988 RepID=UPI00273546FF|nr:GNAT family N-acetyltransferase [Humidesulfovibrio sp.]MDP2848433.1 GNAT family N-acetyltransferase [Humidesulfovibrio sp.]